MSDIFLIVATIAAACNENYKGVFYTISDSKLTACWIWYLVALFAYIKPILAKW